MIITISREFGSGGRELARRLAEELNIEYYDREIVEELAKHTAFSEEYLHEITSKRIHPLYPITIGRHFRYLKNHAYEHSQHIFLEQSRLLKELAEKSDCVIVGRCADVVLKDYKPIRIFTYADMDSKIARCRIKGGNEEHYTDQEMKQFILGMDKERAEYHQYYTGQVWGQKEHYDLCINTSHRSMRELAHKLAGIYSSEC